MGSRIRRAVGWGMDWNTFEQTIALDCEVDKTFEAFEAVMDAATVDTLTVPWEDRRKSWGYYGPGPRHSAIIDPVLLARDMEFTGSIVKDEDGQERRERDHSKGFGRPEDLFSLVWNGDDSTHILFWPTVQVAKEFSRRDDELDYAFEQYRDGDSEGGPRTFVTPMKFNPYPWANNIMDPATGAALEWVPYFTLDREYPAGWAPSPPSEILWWTQKLGIFDEAGALKLRPMLAQWWA